MTELADAFIDALGVLEREGEVEPLVALYASDAVIGNVLHPDKFEGPDGAGEFWTAYRRQFGQLGSEFRNVVVADGVVALEWRTDATVDGRQVTYSGVTVLEVDGGSIKRSCAYFDPSALGRDLAR